MGGSPGGHFCTTWCTPLDVLASKSLSPPYTALTWGVPACNAEVVNTAVPPFNGAVPSAFETLKVTVSPFGGAGVTTAVKVTACPRVDGFGEEVRTVVVTLADGFTSITKPQPPVP